MIEVLSKIFSKLDLSWIDSIEEIDASREFFEVLTNFPNLMPIFQEGKVIDEGEFKRTVRHIFRLFKVYFLFRKDDYFHDTLSRKSIETIRKKLLYQNSQNELIIPIILMYHDIGRLIDKNDHSIQSFQLVSRLNLFEPFALSTSEKLLVKLLIKYHLLFAKIYTGESTYFGIYALLKDPEFVELTSDENFINRFVDLLEIFTYIDILGYSYAKIYDHYIKYYNEINLRLKNILNCLPDKKSALIRAKEYSQEWLEWRLAGALRIFQFVETKPYLTEEFYFQKLKESIKTTENKLLSTLTWELITKNYLTQSYKIQLNYSLAFLMILAFSSFQRMGLKINSGISYKLILFWTLLCKEIISRSEIEEESPWNVFFEGMPHWSKINISVINMLNDQTIEKIIHNSKQKYDKSNEEHYLYLDFNQVFK
ncbi:hypothetical protein LCGC14_0934240 [marine sediment metagenome]|uniref:Uncharacterized protein n=1 Tax=marine sediment metagenome TaxID=412755 RepID=A0A0F9NM12_9ZZZZ